MFAKLVLYSWPLVTLYLFKRLPLREALVWSVVVGYLMMPQIVGFDMPLVPPISKTLVANISVAIMCVAFARARMSPARPALPQAMARAPLSDQTEPKSTGKFVVRRGKILFWGLISLLFVTTVFTVLDNDHPLIQGVRIVQPLRIYDVFTINFGLLVMILPFLLGRRFLATPNAHLLMMKIFVIACLGYSLLALWEIRMSPQLNRQIYGFSNHVFAQNMRGGGFRPMVFMNHGLWLAIVFAMGCLASMAIWRDQLKSPQASRWLFASIYLFLVLVMCKSFGALIIAIALLPLLFVFGVGMQLFAAAIVSCIILMYPLLRGADIVPTQAIVNLTESIDEKRAHSIRFRFNNEDELLDHANKKPISGWGTWGRNRVTNEKGVNVAATDGFWVIVAGVHGWLGYIAHFGLLTSAVIMLGLNRRRLQLTHATSGVAIVVVGAMIDLIPNATISPITWLFAGALMGRYQTAEAVVKETNIRKAAEALKETEAPADQPVAADRPVSINRGRPLHQRRPREG